LEDGRYGAATVDDGWEDYGVWLVEEVTLEFLAVFKATGLKVAVDRVHSHVEVLGALIYADGRLLGPQSSSHAIEQLRLYAFQIVRRPGPLNPLLRLSLIFEAGRRWRVTAILFIF